MTPDPMQRGTRMDQPATTARTMLTLTIMLLGPPLVLVGLVLAEVMPFRAPAADWGVIALLWAMGIAALAWSRWPRPVRVAVAAAHTILGVPALLLVALFAVCSTGDCI